MQIGDENVHLVRAVLDEVFGSENFCSLVTFRKTTGANSPVAKVNTVASVTDFIIWYAKDHSRLKYRQLYQEKDLRELRNYSWVEENGALRPITEPERRPAMKPDRVVQLENATSAGYSATLSQAFYLNGVEYRPGGTSHWKTTPRGMEILVLAGRLVPRGRTLNYKRYFDDFSSYPLTNIWTDIRVGYASDKRYYVVQTSAQVVERCLLMTTDPGDLVLDPTCGSGTTASVAEQWGRRWITIDTSRVALALARQRIMGARFPYYLLADSTDGREKEATLTGSPLAPAEPRGDIRQGFVYERVQHITLKSIANNPDIREGMTREEIDEAIRRHADFELLYDRPYEDKRKVRVAGPFTVESLSPHRSLAFAAADEPASERRAAQDPTGATFEQTILANLAAAGIQNGRKKERLEFDEVGPHAGLHIQAVGVPKATDDGVAEVRRVGVAIGPQYGTVGPPFIKAAAREALQTDGDEQIDLLCILGFAFDPTALDATEEFAASTEDFAQVAGERRLGRIPVLLVRMNADLVMGEELKKTGAGNLFTVFGEPDIAITPVGEDELQVEVRGVDVYDPTTGEVRSDDTSKIALWMIDSDYNGESFFVRHAYFTGGIDPYKRLKTALKAEIDEDAWASLSRTVSRPFPRPSSGRIAVKVINDYGDEVMKVYET